MPSFDDRPGGLLGSLSKPRVDQPASGPVGAGENTPAASPTVPIQPPNAPTPSTGQLTPLTPAITRQLSALQNSPGVTRVLPGISENTSQRIPVVIKGEMKKIAAPSPLPPPEKEKRRLLVSLAGIVILLLMTAIVLLSASPLGQEIGLSISSLQQGSLFNNHNPTVNGLIAQATATAVYHQQTDGYDPYYSGNQIITNGSASRDWPAGECTYWANSYYHQLTGYWISWNGNADQWVAGAQKAGWNTSSSPHVPSIVVLMPGTQGASRAYGHVAVVESVTGNTVHTSNMNWYANGGGFNRVSNVDFTTGPGVYFVWHS